MDTASRAHPAALRDDAEALIRGWDRLERSQGRQAVIDYDCFPIDQTVQPVDSRVDVARRLADLLDRASDGLDHGGPDDDSDTRDDLATDDPDDDPRWLIDRLTADLTHVRALLGERLPLHDHLLRTQGVPARWFADDEIDRRRQQAVDALHRLDVAWGPETLRHLQETEGRLTASETADQIRSEAERLEPAVRAYAATDAPFELAVEEVDVDAYWAYWLDGAGSRVRLRINIRQANFTRIRARQLALHEVLGHALQSASFHRQAEERPDVPWVRLLAVHAPHQVLLEGLAQALPLFVTPGDPALLARTRLVHHNQLVRARLHVAINDGVPVDDCLALARRLAPFWSDGGVGDLLTDRSNDPLLRSYLWSYPAGMDWFVALHETVEDPRPVIRRCYRDPLHPWGLERALADATADGGPPGGGPAGGDA